MAKPSSDLSVARLLAQLLQTTKAFEMRTRPELLLQKKDVVYGRGPNPAAHSRPEHRVLAHPLIEDCERDNLGVERKMREAASGMMEASIRLPRLLTRADRVLEELDRRVETRAA